MPLWKSCKSRSSYGGKNKRPSSISCRGANISCGASNCEDHPMRSSSGVDWHANGIGSIRCTISMSLSCRHLLLRFLCHDGLAAKATKQLDERVYDRGGCGRSQELLQTRVRVYLTSTPDEPSSEAKRKHPLSLISRQSTDQLSFI